LRRLWWNRSILPVVVGERTPVWRWEMPDNGKVFTGRFGPHPVLPQDPIEQDLHRQDLIADAVAIKRSGEHLADGLGGRSHHQAGGDAEAAVVVDPGHDLCLGAVLEHYATHHVHLPQLHRTLPLEATELLPPFPAPAQLDQAVAPQAPVDARARRDDVGAGPRELVLDAPRSPAGMLAPELADHGLQLGGDLVRAGRRTVGTVGQRGQTTTLVAGDPGVDALAGHPEPSGDLDHLPAVLHHREHRLVPLFHDAELHEHGPPPPRPGPRQGEGREGRRQASPGATVNDQPDPTSTISRSGVKAQVTPERSASPGTRHFVVPPAV